MAKKSKTSKSKARKSTGRASRADDYELLAQVRGSANQIWLAGLGAFADTRKQGNKLFDSLVKEGKAFQKRAGKAAEGTMAEVKATATKSWDKLEKMFEEGVAGALHTLNVPTKKEFDRLARRVAELLMAKKKPSGAGGKPARKR